VREVEIPPALLALAAGQAGLVSTAQCDRGGLDRSQRHRLVARGRARVVTRGVLDLAPTLSPADQASQDPDHDRRRAAVLALLAHGPRAISVGQCALTLLGIQGLPKTIRPEVMLPGGARRPARDGIVVRRFERTLPTVALGPFRVAAAPWALAQSVCELDRTRAISVLDSAVQRGLIGPDGLGTVERLAAGRRGAARLHDWWPLVDGRAQSPLETQARLQCVDASIPPDDLQVPIRGSSGRVVARGDLGWRLRQGRWLIAEIDGVGPHSSPVALFRDRERQNAVIATGRAEVLRFTAEDLARDGLLAATVMAFRAQDELAHRSRRSRAAR
jgi:hypothetical protein